MEFKDYSTCSCALDLVVRAMQNAIISLMRDEQLIHSLEVGNYVYRSLMMKALADNAKPNKVFHAAMEVERYCQEHHDCERQVFTIFCKEIIGGIVTHGLRIHKQRLEKYHQAFKSKKL